MYVFTILLLVQRVLKILQLLQSLLILLQRLGLLQVILIMKFVPGIQLPLLRTPLLRALRLNSL